MNNVLSAYGGGAQSMAPPIPTGMSSTPGPLPSYLRAPQGAPSPQAPPEPPGGGMNAAGMNGMPQLPSSLGAPAQPSSPTVGANGFGVHPDATHNELRDLVMQALGHHESQNNYNAQNPKSTASGKYQYINSTWNNYGGYPRAKDAPPEIQEQRMREDTQSALQRFGGDPFKVVANHYYPKYASDPSKWNDPITDKYGKEVPGAGTVAQYVSKVLPADRVSKYMAGAQAPSQVAQTGQEDQGAQSG